MTPMTPMPPMDMPDEMEGAGPEEQDAPGGGDLGTDLDPQFAADVSEAFPDLSDEQCAALQRAVLGLMGR